MVVKNVDGRINDFRGIIGFFLYVPNLQDSSNAETMMWRFFSPTSSQITLRLSEMLRHRIKGSFSQNSPRTPISRAASPKPVPATPRLLLNGKQRERILPCLFAVVPNGRISTEIQTLTIGNDDATKLLTSHNLEG